MTIKYQFCRTTNTNDQIQHTDSIDSVKKLYQEHVIWIAVLLLSLLLLHCVKENCDVVFKKCEK